MKRSTTSWYARTRASILRGLGADRFEAGSGKGKQGMTRHDRGQAVFEALEPRVLLSANPFQSTVYTFLNGSRAIILDGPGGYGGAPLLDLNGDKLGDMIVQYTSHDSSGNPHPVVAALLSNLSGPATIYTIASLPNQSRIDQAVITGLNSSGNPDVVVFWDDGQDNYYINDYVWHAGGTYTASPTTINVGSYESAPKFSVFDMTGNHKADLLVQLNNTVTVYLGNGDGTFAAPVTTKFSTILGGSAYMSFETDVTGDGIDDMVISGSNSTLENVLAVYPGLATGGYSATPSYIDSTDNMNLLEITPLTKNGPEDLIAYELSPLAFPGSSTTLVILHNNGKGNFTQTFSETLSGGLLNQLVAGIPIQPLTITDLNKDGLPDIVALEGSELGSTVTAHILINQGNAQFTDAQDFTVDDISPSESTVDVADVDGDGFPDLTFTQLTGSWQVTTFFNKGNGTFVTPGVTVTPPELVSLPPVLADLANNGKLDVVFGGVTDADVFMNTTGRAFSTTAITTDFPNGEQFLGGMAGDMTGDNLPDIISYGVSSASGNVKTVTNFSIEQGNGDGTFTAVAPYSVLAQAADAIETPIIADINGDGKPDLVFDDGQGIYELINGAAAPADPAGGKTPQSLGTLTGPLSVTGYIQPPLPSTSNSPDIDDTYSFTLASPETVRVSVTPALGQMSVNLSKSNGSTVADGTSASPSVAEAANLAAGNYTISVETAGQPAGNFWMYLEFPTSAAEIGVLQGTTQLTSGQMPGVNFGSVLVNTTDTEHDFTVVNNGDATLNLDSVKLPAGFTLGSQSLPATLAPGDTATLSVDLDVATAGDHSGDIDIASNDPNTPTFAIPVMGEVTGTSVTSSAAAISVTGPGGAAVTSGQSTPINVGTAGKGAASPSVSFTVKNTGNATLDLDALSFPGGFKAGSPTLPATIAAGASATFAVELSTANAGDVSGNISFTTNDPNANMFLIPVSGSVQASALPFPATELAFTTPPAASTVAGATLSKVVVKIEGAHGKLETTDDAPVSLTVESGPGSFSGTSITTVAAVDGVATFSHLVLDTAGIYKLAAADAPDSLSGFTSASFKITPAAAASVTFGLQPANFTAGGKMGSPVTVTVRDAFGNLVSGARVTLSLSAKPAKGAVTSALSAATSSAGVATFIGLSARVAGQYSLVAAVGKVTSVASHDFVVSPAAVSTLTFTEKAATAIAGQSFSPAFAVVAKDAYGNLVSGVVITLAAKTKPVGGALLGTLTAVTSGAGIATFSGVLAQVAGKYTVAASWGKVSSAVANLTVAPAAAQKLVYATPPANATAGVKFKTKVVVKIEDAFGNVVNSNSKVSLSIASGPGAFTATSTTIVNAVGGVATFANLAINTPGNYTVEAGDSTFGLDVTSSTFMVA